MDLARLLPGRPAEDTNRVLAPHHTVSRLGENPLKDVIACELDEEMTSDGMLKSIRQFLQVKANILLEKVHPFRDRHSTLPRIGASDVPTDCSLQADKGVKTPLVAPLPSFPTLTTLRQSSGGQPKCTTRKYWDLDFFKQL